MRGLFLLSGALLLASCGEGEDFTISVAMSPSAAQSELARLDGGTMIGMTKIPALTAASDGDELVYVIPGDGENGELTMWFEEVGPNRTRIHVDVSVPDRQIKVGGKSMVVAENKVESELRNNLATWAKGVREHGYASLDPVNDTLGQVMLLLNVDSDSEEDIAALISPEFMGGPESAEEPSYDMAEGDAAEPSMDSGAGTDMAGAPMDNARGEAAEGYDPNASEPETLAYDSGY